ncbi:nonstructural protein 3 [Tenuivirus oryzalbae]|uniref:Suppressor of RNA silencing p3 n=2 Tax=Rice hoja blanca virus (strain cr) TaxID=480611 RepID=VSR_RHBVC|nr:RecName: Full=Suppressor of RNA silencing p3; AltName: Full=Protein NS3; AltName: Full=Protein p3 [Rice hoja blanca virus - cr]AAA53423.1 nonstructural protein 3 [Tenuivirus oryzalbae]
MNVSLYYSGTPVSSHSLLSKNGLSNIVLTCKDLPIPIDLLSLFFDILNERHPSFDEHMFLQMIRKPDDPENLSVFLKSAIWMLSHKRDLPGHYRLPLTCLVSTYSEYFVELKPRQPSTKCWFCKIAKDGLPFRVEGVHGFPSEAELYIVPSKEHAIESFEVLSGKKLYRSPSKKKHGYLIASNKPPLTSKYVEYDPSKPDTKP